MDSCKIFFRRKMPISSNFHFSSKLARKLNLETDTQFITLDLDKINHTPKNQLFLTENYPLTIFPIQFPDKILIPFFRIFSHTISNFPITTIKFSLKNYTQKYRISGTTSQFSHFFVKSYHFSGQVLHIPLER